MYQCLTLPIRTQEPQQKNDRGGRPVALGVGGGARSRLSRLGVSSALRFMQTETYGRRCAAFWPV
jgi:hypothetical protein